MKTQEQRSINGGGRLQTTPTEPLWTVADVASYLRMDEETIRAKARSGEIPGVKIGKVWRFKVSEIKDMLTSRKSRSA